MSAQVNKADLGVAGSGVFIAISGWLIVLGGVGLGVVRFYRGVPALEQNAEGALGATAFGALVAAPGLLALLSLFDRPLLLLPAAILLIPLAFLSLAGVMLPLLIPAGMLFVAYGRRSARLPRRPGHSAATTILVLALLVAAGAVLFTHQDQRSYATPTSGGGVSDVITYVESVTALLVIACAIAFAWFATAPFGTSTSK